MNEFINLTSNAAIAFGGLLALLTIHAFAHEEQVVKWEERHIIVPFRRFRHRIRCYIAQKLRNNAKFMDWLNQPPKQGKPDEDFICGQIKVFGDVWK